MTLNEYCCVGSIHVHGFIWLKGAPAFDVKDPSTFDACCTFVDRFISCVNDDDLAKYQRHKHKGCQKYMVGTSEPKKYKCRFSFPQVPMKKTMILLPHPVDFKGKERDRAGKTLKKIKQWLEDNNEKKRNVKLDLSFDAFLQSVCKDKEGKPRPLSEDEYIEAVRCGLSRPTVMLKREVNSAFINGYNPVLADVWAANVVLVIMIINFIFPFIPFCDTFQAVTSCLDFRFTIYKEIKLTSV